jgi:hypothetical protein
MLSARENYCPDQVTFSGAEPSHPTTVRSQSLGKVPPHQLRPLLFASFLPWLLASHGQPIHVHLHPNLRHLAALKMDLFSRAVGVVYQAGMHRQHLLIAVTQVMSLILAEV